MCGRLNLSLSPAQVCGSDLDFGSYRHDNGPLSFFFVSFGHCFGGVEGVVSNSIFSFEQHKPAAVLYRIWHTDRPNTDLDTYVRTCFYLGFGCTCIGVE